MKNKVKRFFIRIKHLFTGHDKNLIFVTNIYGDAIEAFNGKRSIWECPGCGGSVYKDELFTSMKLSETGLKNDELLEKLKTFQKYGIPHPLTCCSPKGCLNNDDESKRLMIPKEVDGVVILECPCGKDIQDWVPAMVITMDTEKVVEGMKQKGFTFD